MIYEGWGDNLWRIVGREITLTLYVSYIYSEPHPLWHTFRVVSSNVCTPPLYFSLLLFFPSKSLSLNWTPALSLLSMLLKDTHTHSQLILTLNLRLYSIYVLLYNPPWHPVLGGLSSARESGVEDPIHHHTERYIVEQPSILESQPSYM